MFYSYFESLFVPLLLVSTAIFARLLFKILFNNKTEPRKSADVEATNGRPLDSLEYLLDELQRLEGGNLCTILCLESKTSLNNEYVHEALAMVSKRQPMLRTVIDRKSQGIKTEKFYKVLPKDQIKIDIQRPEVSATDWAQVWSKTVCEQFDTERGPLWRVNILQEEFRPEINTYLNTILFVFSHAAIDGISSLKFCEQFLRNLNAIADGCAMKEVESFPMLPSAMEFVCHKTRWPEWQKYLGLPQLWGMLLRFLIRLHIRRMARNPFFSRYPPITQEKLEGKPMIEVRELSTTETSEVMAACKSNDSTVHGALLAACNIAFTKLIDAPYDEKVKLENGLSVSLLPDCSPKVPDDYLGNFVAELRMKLPPKDEQHDFWGLAKRTTNQLHEKIKGGQHLKDCVGLIETIGHEFFSSELLSSTDPETMMRMSYCFHLSNPGRFVWEDGDDRQFRAERCLFTAASHRTTCVFTNFVATVNGKLSWVVCYNDALVKAKLAKEFLRLSVHELLKYCKAYGTSS